MSGFLLNPYTYSQAVVTDPYWANVKNLIGFENGLTDEKTGSAWTSGGALAPSTTNPKFGSYCLPAATAAQEYISYDMGSVQAIPFTSELLLEGFINPTSYLVFGTFFELWYTGAGQGLWLGYNGTNDNKLLLYVGGASAIVSTAIANLYDGNYKYVAIYRPANSSQYSLYVENALVGTSGVTADVSYQYFRMANYSGSGYPSHAKIDEVRLTIGGSRGAPTTIPTTAFPRS